MRQIPHRTLLILLAILPLATMLGCQGLSARSNVSQPAPGELTATVANVAFGNVGVGASETLANTLTNMGAASLDITAASVNNPAFAINGLTFPTTLAPGQSTSFNIVFQPQSVGGVIASLALTNTGSGSVLNVPLAGTGIVTGVLSTSPSSFNFGTVAVGGNTTQTETLQNSGGASLTISQANVTGSGFSVTGLSMPLTLAPGQNTTFGVKFAPTAAGAVNGLVSLSFTGSSNTADIALSGTGATPAVLTPTLASVTFTSIAVGQNSTQTETVTNTGGSSTTISAVSASGTGFSVSGITPPVTLTPGQSTSFTVKFAPASAGTFNGTVTVTSDASNPSLSIPLTGTATTPAAVLTASPTSLTFTNIIVGQNSSQTETIKNTGGTSATISAVAASGTGFSISGITPPVTLTPGQSTSFSVKFAPASAGTFNGTVTVTSDASNPSLSIPLTGTAVAAGGTLTANPGTVTVPGNVVVGTSGTATGQLAAATASVKVSSVSVVGSEFTISGLSFPVTIPAGQSATYTVTFTPTASGSASTTATFTSNASNAPTGVNLAGTAIPAPVYTVNLAWTGSGSTGVVGYYIYRALYNTTTKTCGSYTKQNPSSPNGPTTYTDSNGITDGDTYCYQVTAVNGTGQESTDSNMATAIIPAP